MQIFHLLFTRHRGGLEQSFLDYNAMLTHLGHAVTACVSSHAPYLPEVMEQTDHVRALDPRGFYDIRACWQLHNWLKQERPALIMAHNAKAITIARIASRGLSIPLLGVTHSYKTTRTLKAHALIILTPHMRDVFHAAGKPQERLWVVPNMMAMPDTLPLPHAPHSPPVIGAIGRLSPEKGFADWLHALAALKQNGISFRAVLAGEGEERSRLEQLATRLQLQDRLNFIGWVEDKTTFYHSIDLLCVPSHQESFGLIVLEAMAHGVPILATNAPGPGTIITNGKDGRIVSIGDVTALTDTLQHMLAHPDETQQLALQARHTVQNYRKETIARLLGQAIEGTISSYR